MGILQGTHAQVRNIGGQWLSQVEEPVVEVQVVDPDPQMVRTNLSAEVQRLGVELAGIEKELKVPAGQTVELQATPKDPVVHEVVTPRSRAMAGYGLAGLGFSLCATWAADRLLSRRRPAHSPRRPASVNREDQTV
ncbi:MULTISPECIES: hypothetical protein [unclassified Luteococcus]|uniref:hypothetical protein n=1 Tax=unclassified Luteococcus TaxID=2639923 RepID=UPI00313ED83E